jgi:predicted protein tyrosine phosphatase
MRVLFICSQNRLRSPTAESVFANFPGVEVASAGTHASATNPLTEYLVEWAELIFVMQKTHQEHLWAHFKSQLDGKKVVCLRIPDKYAFMDTDLVELLREKVTPHLC